MDMIGYRLSVVGRIRHSDVVGLLMDPIGSCGVVSTWVLSICLSFSLFIDISEKKEVILKIIMKFEKEKTHNIMKQTKFLSSSII